MRNNADYDLLINGDPAVARSQAVLKAERSLARIHNFPENIIDEIKKKI
jgi:hypothetical protein